MGSYKHEERGGPPVTTENAHDAWEAISPHIDTALEVYRNLNSGTRDMGNAAGDFIRMSYDFRGKGVMLDHDDNPDTPPVDAGEWLYNLGSALGKRQEGIMGDYAEEKGYTVEGHIERHGSLFGLPSVSPEGDQSVPVNATATSSTPKGTEFENQLANDFTTPELQGYLDNNPNLTPEARVVIENALGIRTANDAEVPSGDQSVQVEAPTAAPSSGPTEFETKLANDFTAPDLQEFLHNNPNLPPEERLVIENALGIRRTNDAALPSYWKVGWEERYEVPEGITAGSTSDVRAFWTLKESGSGPGGPISRERGTDNWYNTSSLEDDSGINLEGTTYRRTADNTVVADGTVSIGNSTARVRTTYIRHPDGTITSHSRLVNFYQDDAPGGGGGGVAAAADTRNYIVADDGTVSYAIGNQTYIVSDEVLANDVRNAAITGDAGNLTGGTGKVTVYHESGYVITTNFDVPESHEPATSDNSNVTDLFERFAEEGEPRRFFSREQSTGTWYDQDELGDDSGINLVGPTYIIVDENTIIEDNQGGTERRRTTYTRHPDGTITSESRLVNRYKDDFTSGGGGGGGGAPPTTFVSQTSNGYTTIRTAEGTDLYNPDGEYVKSLDSDGHDTNTPPGTPSSLATASASLQQDEDAGLTTVEVTGVTAADNLTLEDLRPEIVPNAENPPEPPPVGSVITPELAAKLGNPDLAGQVIGRIDPDGTIWSQDAPPIMPAVGSVITPEKAAELGSPDLAGRTVSNIDEKGQVWTWSPDEVRHIYEEADRMGLDADETEFPLLAEQVGAGHNQERRTFVKEVMGDDALPPNLGHVSDELMDKAEDTQFRNITGREPTGDPLTDRAILGQYTENPITDMSYAADVDAADTHFRNITGREPTGDPLTDRAILGQYTENPITDMSYAADVDAFETHFRNITGREPTGDPATDMAILGQYAENPITDMGYAGELAVFHDAYREVVGREPTGNLGVDKLQFQISGGTFAPQTPTSPAFDPYQQRPELKGPNSVWDDSTPRTGGVNISPELQAGAQSQQGIADTVAGIATGGLTNLASSHIERSEGGWTKEEAEAQLWDTARYGPFIAMLPMVGASTVPQVIRGAGKLPGWLAGAAKNPKAAAPALGRGLGHEAIEEGAEFGYAMGINMMQGVATQGPNWWDVGGQTGVFGLLDTAGNPIGVRRAPSPTVTPPPSTGSPTPTPTPASPNAAGTQPVFRLPDGTIIDLNNPQSYYDAVMHGVVPS